MNRKYHIKHLPAAALALLIGVSGGYVFTAQSMPIGANSQGNIITQPFCSRNTPLTDFALIIGVCGNFAANHPGQENFISEFPRPLNSVSSGKVISYTESYVSEISCGQIIPRIAGEWAPLTGEEFDGTEWNEQSENILLDV